MSLKEGDKVVFTVVKDFSSLIILESGGQRVSLPPHLANKLERISTAEEERVLLPEAYKGE